MGLIRANWRNLLALACFIAVPGVAKRAPPTTPPLWPKARVSPLVEHREQKQAGWRNLAESVGSNYCSAPKYFAAKLNNLWPSRKIFWSLGNSTGRPQTLRKNKKISPDAFW